MATRDLQTLRYASIVAMLLGLILVVIGLYSWYQGKGSAAPFSSGLGAIVIGGICYQTSRRNKSGSGS
jgi:ABC-type Mn2+/Zn2+ transport system permease subunit